MNCFTCKTNGLTRKTLVGANRVRIHVKSTILRIKLIVLRVRTSVLHVKHWINDPFGHKLQTTLINVTTFYP